MTSKSFAAPNSAPPPKAALSASAQPPHPASRAKRGIRLLLVALRVLTLPPRTRSYAASSPSSYGSSTVYPEPRRLVRASSAAFVGSSTLGLMSARLLDRQGGFFPVYRSAAFALALTPHSTELEAAPHALLRVGPSLVSCLLCLCRTGFASAFRGCLYGAVAQS